MKRPDKDAPRGEAVNIRYDTTNEVVVIAAVVHSPEYRKAYLGLPADYFFGPGHADMWIALQELYRRGLEYTPEAVHTLSGDKVDSARLDEYVRSRPAPPANLAHHVSTLSWDKLRHDVAVGPLGLLLDGIKDPTKDPELIRGLANQIHSSLRGGGLRYLRSAEIVTREHSAELTRRRETQAVFPLGIDGVDLWGPEDFEEVTEEVDGRRQRVKKPLAGTPRVLPGLEPGGTTALLGVSGHGKTVVTCHIVLRQVALKRLVLWGAWEQKPGKTLELLATISLMASRSDFAGGNYEAEHQAMLEAEMRRLGEYVKFFDLPFGRTRGDEDRYNDRNLDLIHQYVAESACDLFIGDVFTYALNDHRPQEVSRAIRRMNGMSQETRTHSLLVHHLNLKELESRADHRPTRDVVFGTQGWINDVDNALAVHCPGIHKPPNDKMEFHFLKQRSGKWGIAVECGWEPTFGDIWGGTSIDVGGATTGVGSVGDYLEESRHGGSGYRKRNR